MCLINVYSLFTDDCLVYRKIESERDIEILQNDLANELRALGEKMDDFNADKCEAIQITMKPITSKS